jgi:hypothetical protein
VIQRHTHREALAPVTHGLALLPRLADSPERTQLELLL